MLPVFVPVNGRGGRAVCLADELDDALRQDAPRLDRQRRAATKLKLHRLLADNQIDILRQKESGGKSPSLTGGGPIPISRFSASAMAESVTAACVSAETALRSALRVAD